MNHENTDQILNRIINDFIKYSLQLYNASKITRKQYIEMTYKKVQYMNLINSLK
jgi:hypothetical protein